MSLKDPLHDGQMELLQWIGNGCPDGRWEGQAYKTSAMALVSRRLVTVSKKGGVWRATLLPAGSYYLDHGEYPEGHWGKTRGSVSPSANSNAVSDRVDSAPPPAPRSRSTKKSSQGLTPTRQLLADLVAAGGVLERSSREDKTQYANLAASINRHGMAPDGQHVVVYSGRRWGEHVIKLVSISEWQTESPVDVLARERIGRWHPVVAELRQTGRLDDIPKRHRRRAAALLHCLATEAAARGVAVEIVKKIEGRDYYARRNQPPGLLMLNDQEFQCPVGVWQLQDQIPHEPTKQELERRQRWDGAFIPKYDQVLSDRSAIVTHNAASYPSEKAWAGTKTRRLEDRLVDILAAFTTWVAADVDRRERHRIEEAERTRRREHENTQARAAYIEHATGERLKQDAAAWAEAERLRTYLAAMRARAAGIEDQSERSAADEWMVWCQHFVDETVDPLGKPIQRPEVPEPSDKELAEFRGRLGFGTASWY